MRELLTTATLAKAEQAVALLKAGGHTVATAESLTAGLCCAALTTISGSSAVVRGGLIVYATDLKGTLAGVPQDVLEEWGPVSEPTARHLAVGASERTSSDWGVALTGVAGPDPQDGHPPGRVWAAVHGPSGGQGPDRTTCGRLDCAGDRTEIRDQAVNGALQMLIDRLREH
jgi:nicotinamide-nucleotide amidase